jgi:spore germination protein (amino acid permease)
MERKISKQQVFFIIAIGVSGSIRHMEASIVDYADRAAIIASVCGILLNIPLFLWSFHILLQYPGLNIFEILDRTLGKVLSWVFTLGYICINIVLAVCLMNLFSGLVGVYFLNNTPFWVLMMVFVILGILFSSKDCKALGLFYQSVFLVLFINYLATILFLIHGFKIDYIFPPLPESVGGFLKGILLSAGCTSEGILLVLLFENLDDSNKKINKTVSYSLLTFAFLFGLSEIIQIGVTGYQMYLRTYNPSIYAFSIIQLGNFARGMESFILLTFQMIFFARLSAYFYCINKAFLKNSNVKKKRIIISIISSSVVFLLSNYLDSYNKSYIIQEFMDQYVLIPFIIFTLIVTSLAIKIKKGVRQNEA